ncbi:gephyrin-like molybdotransferase Glp, partial [Chloroflexota bacterium]
LETETSPILDCLGQVIAEDIDSSINIPPLDNSAMDGYAIQTDDSQGATPQSPRMLKVIDTVPAGSISSHKVTPGTAIRIMTGAPVPKGADSVVPFEDTDELERQKYPAEIGILHNAKPGQNIRRQGEDITQGTTVLCKGTVIRPAEVGLLASLGMSTVKVIRRPVFAILATGNELADINQPLATGKIYNSNTYSVSALVKHYGGIPKILGIAPDDYGSLTDILLNGLEADMLITSGGISAGDYDMVKDVLSKEGEIAFWKVQMKPGKPLAFGTIKGINRAGATTRIPHLGLPGNPVSSMITFELFGRPALLKMMGKKNLDRHTISVITEDSIVNTDERRIFARAIIEKRNGRYFARWTGPQGSGILTSMSLANGLVIVPEGRDRIEAGEVLQAIRLDWDKEN